MPVSALLKKNWFCRIIEEGYFEYGNFEFENGLLRKTKWGTKIKHFKQVPNNLAQLKRGPLTSSPPPPPPTPTPRRLITDLQ